MISTNSSWWLCGTSSSPYLTLSYLTQTCLCGSCMLAPKSPWRDRAGSLLLKLLSKLSVYFDGCVLQPRGERRLQDSPKLRGVLWGPPGDGHQGSSTVLLSRRFVHLLLFQPWEEMHMTSDMGLMTHMTAIP